jgi:hypothetical protein
MGVYLVPVPSRQNTQPISLDDGEDNSPELLPDSNRTWERIFEDLDTHIYIYNKGKEKGQKIS